MDDRELNEYVERLEELLAEDAKREMKEDQLECLWSRHEN